MEKARELAPACAFAQGDFTTWAPAEPVDLIYSNAALHWRGEHRSLFPRLLGHLAPGGVLAVQMPAMHNAPLRALQHDIAANGPWAERLIDVDAAPPHPLGRANTTTCCGPTSPASISGKPPTSMCCPAKTPWCSGPPEPASNHSSINSRPPSKKGFLAAYAEAIRPEYPSRPDGMTLLPFHRLFLLGRLAG